jgi:hypothetical protein
MRKYEEETQGGTALKRENTIGREGGKERMAPESEKRSAERFVAG